MRVALIHEWLVKSGGSEQVLGRLARLFPQATVFPLVWRRGLEREFGIDPARIRPSRLDRLPGARRFYKALLPFYPGAVEAHDLREFDLVIANHHCVAHGARAREGAPLISHCHTPVRYAWELREEYLRGAGLDRPLVGAFARGRLDRLRGWDRAASTRVTAFLPSSENAAARIARHYGRESADVIHPAVDLVRFFPPARAPARGRRFLVVSRLVNYKRVDAAIRLATRPDGICLRIAGSGPAERALRRLAADGPVEFTGRIPDAALAGEYHAARALLCPGEEDFGLTAVEAFAAGCPVIHAGRGGFLEIARLVLGELGGRLTMARLEANDPGLATDLDEATALLAQPESRERLRELFGPARFESRFRAAVVAIAGGDAAKAMASA